MREGRRHLEQHRWRHPEPIRRSRRERLLLAAQRLEGELDTERRDNEAQEHNRATARDGLGRRLGGRPDPYRPPQVPAGKVNVTDPDSCSIPIGFGFGFVQGDNAQAAVNEQQIVLAAEITNNSTDFTQLDPMVTAPLEELKRAGSEQLPEAVAADAGYWNEQHMDEVVAHEHILVLIPPGQGQSRQLETDVDRRALRVDAPPALDRARPAALPKTLTDRRAAVRRHRAQQRGVYGFHRRGGSRCALSGDC